MPSFSSPPQPKDLIPLPGLNAIAWTAAFGWAALLGGSLWFEQQREHDTALTYARIEATVSYEKDLVYRRWVSSQGGVYVAPSKHTPANPYLAHLAERDVVTTTGKALTLVNPAYMTRQVHELADTTNYGVRGHITSINPLRPENAADAWETAALRAFESGATEAAEALTAADGTPVFRFMRPFITEESCLKCHASQGYKVGDIRGGLSAEVPLAPYFAAASSNDPQQYTTHGLFLALGLAGIFFARRHLAHISAQRQTAYTALRESEGRTRQLFEKLPLLVATCNTEGTIAYGNPALLGLCGRSLAETIGQDYFELIPPREQRAAAEAAFKQALQSRSAPASSVTEIISRDGRRRTIAWISTLITDSRGEAVGVTSLGEDITERRAEDLRLRLLSRAVEHSPVTIVITDITGKIEYVNEKFTRLTGYTRTEALGLNPRVLNAGTHPPEFYRELWATILAGGEWHGEFHNRKKSGEVFWEDAHISPIRDETGTIVRFIAIKEDITERKRSAQAIAESEQRFRALLENAPVAVVVHRANRCLYSNLAASRIFGYSDRTATEGLDIWLHLQPESLPVVNERMRVLHAGGRPPPVELHLRQRDGTPIVCESSVTPITYDGQPAALAIMADVTERRQMVAALEESEARFRSFVETAPLAIFTLVNSRFAYANPATARLFGYSEASLLIGQSLWSRVHSESLNPATTLLTDAETGQPGRPVELKLLRRDGTLRLGETVAVPITFGSQPATMAIVTDITERKQLEQALRENEARMQETLESTSAGYFRLDAQDRLLHANSAWLQLFDLPRLDHATARPLPDLLPEAEREPARDILRRLACGEEYVSGECRHTRADGTLGYYSFTAHLVREGGRLAGCEGFYLDTTDIRSSQERYQMLFEQMLDGFALHEIVCDPAGHPIDYRFLAINPAFEKLMGRPAASFLGRRVREVFPAIEEKWITRYGQLALGGEPLRIVDYSRELDRYFEIVAFRPSPGRFATLVLDVTERRQLEGQLQQAQKMEAVGQLAGGVAHDFNNILVAILMNLSLLRTETNLRPETAESLQELELEAKRAATLTRQLLVFSRRQAVQARPVNLNELLATMVKMLRRILGEHVTIATELAPALPYIHADPGMIDQIIMNLCVNARDAMPAGGRIHLATTRAEFTEADRRAHPQRRPGAFLHLSVGDTGCGMDAATRSHLFEPFFTTKEAGKGTGLGLATVFGIVKQHEGWIEVDSTVGQGSTFHLYLPFSDAESEPEPVFVPPAPTDGTETLLLVEDDVIARQTVSLALRRDGYRVLEADSVEAALAVWAQHRATIAALITDVVMPGGQNGIELAHALRTENPTLGIVIISGYSADTARNLPPIDGATYLAKPFDYATLIAAMRTSLPRK